MCVAKVWLISYSVYPWNRMFLGIYMAVCYRVVDIKSKEFRLFYSKLSESYTFAELTNN